MGRRGRRQLVGLTGLTVALAVSLPALSAEKTQTLTTQTALASELHDVNGSTQANFRITVVGQDGRPATGTITIADQGKPIAGAALNSDGVASAVVTLSPGPHSLTAAYAGDTTHSTSISQVTPVRAAAGATPDFSISVAPTTLSLKQGQSGSITASIAPINSASLTAPMFVTMSCSGLPDQTTCTFTPENLEILPNTTAAVTSSMVLATSAGSTARVAPPKAGRSSRIVWAVLLPGALGLAGLALGARRRAWLAQMALLGLVGLVAVLGTAACSPLYNYHNHGPPHNLPTPTGTFTILISAQSSNGVTAVTHSTTIALTVTQ